MSERPKEPVVKIGGGNGWGVAQEPFFTGWRLRKCRCRCGQKFKTREAYEQHYATAHVMDL